MFFNKEDKGKWTKIENGNAVRFTSLSELNGETHLITMAAETELDANAKKDTSLGGARDDSKNRKSYDASSNVSNNSITSPDKIVKDKDGNFDPDILESRSYKTQNRPLSYQKSVRLFS